MSRAWQPPQLAEKNVAYRIGWFNETLPSFLQSEHPRASIAFMHIDSDLYSSAATVFETLGPKRLRPGAVIVFDEVARASINARPPVARWRPWRANTERHCDPPALSERTP